MYIPVTVDPHYMPHVEQYHHPIRQIKDSNESTSESKAGQALCK